MVTDSGKTAGISACKPVNVPELAQVEENPDGSPAVLKTSRRQKIACIEDTWRIDDEWWRSESISRLYYSVRLISGQKQIIYKDLVNGYWYRQSC